MAVPRGDDHARQHETDLGHHHMLDALHRMQDVEQLDAEIAAILGEILDLAGSTRIGHARRAQRCGGIDVIDGAQGGARPPDRPPGLAQRGEGLRAGIFIEDRAVDIEQHPLAGRVEAADGMAVDQPVIESSARQCRLLSVEGPQDTRPGGKVSCRLRIN